MVHLRQIYDISRWFWMCCSQTLGDQRAWKVGKQPSAWLPFVKLVQESLFDPKKHLRLVFDLEEDWPWNLKTREEICRRWYSSKQGRRSIDHPFNKSVIIWASPSDLQLYNWWDLSALASKPKDEGLEISMCLPKRPPGRQKAINIESFEGTETV